MGSGLADRVLLPAWLVAVAALFAVLAFVLASAVLETQATFAVRFVASISSSCWLVDIDVDFAPVLGEAGRPGYIQCGGEEAQLVAVGKCRTRILVSADFGIAEPAPNSELFVEILRNSVVVEAATFNTNEGPLHSVGYLC